MTYKETMATLEQMGTAQNVKTYKRHGAGNKLFGISFANLNKLQKQIKQDHRLAEQLWKSGNTDARTLALMIADPEQLTSATADAWLKDISYYLLVDMLGGLVAKSKLAPAKTKKWTRSKKEQTRQCGYAVLCGVLRDRSESITDDECLQYLETIEEEIHNSPNRARQAMNTALCAIGIYKPELRAEAIATARRVGGVEVDHGDTSCKTPDAESYIKKAAARKPSKRKTARKKAGQRPKRKRKAATT